MERDGEEEQAPRSKVVATRTRMKQRGQAGITLEGREALVQRSAVSGNRWAPLGVAVWRFLWLRKGGSVEQGKLGEWVSMIRGEKLVGGGGASNSWLFSFLFPS